MCPKRTLEAGIVLHASLLLALKSQKQEDFKLETSLSYTASSRAAWAVWQTEQTGLPT